MATFTYPHIAGRFGKVRALETLDIFAKKRSNLKRLTASLEISASQILRFGPVDVVDPARIH